MTIKSRIAHIQALIQRNAKDACRNPLDILVLAVSKGQDIDAIQEAFSVGISHFGENYWQEAEKKIMQLQNLPIIWHFIGSLQSNKAKDIASHFSWVHTLNRAKIAKLLSENRPAERLPLNVCIQVNLDDEPSKSGILPEKLLPFAHYITQLPNLHLRGLMAIPKMEEDADKQFQSFERLSCLLENTNKALRLKMDTLSMGMSQDFSAAIAAGSTIVRIGEAIFGKRGMMLSR